MKIKIATSSSAFRTLSTKNEKGFTLLEMLVSVALFSVISVFVIGSYIKISSLQRTSSAKNEIASEERFVLDTFGREITWALAIPDCNGCSVMRFASQPRVDISLRTIEYKYDAASQNILKAETKPFGPCEEAPDVGDTKDPSDDTPFPAECYQKVFSDAVKISSLQFFVANNVDDEQQVVVTVAIKGTISVNGSTLPLSLSSTFSPRFIQNTAYLSGGLTPEKPVLTQGSETSSSPSAAFNSCSTWQGWYITWPDAKNTTEYHTYFCAGASCSSNPANWGPSSEIISSGQSRPVSPMPDDDRTGLYRQQIDIPSSVSAGTQLNAAVRAHQHTGDVFSEYSNVISAITPSRSTNPCGTYTPTSPSGQPPPPSSGKGGGNKGGGER